MLGSLTSCDPGNIFKVIEVRRVGGGIGGLMGVWAHGWGGQVVFWVHYVHSPPFSFFKELKSSSIRCSVVGLAAEVRLCKSISQTTQGMPLVSMVMWVMRWQ